MGYCDEPGRLRPGHVTADIFDVPDAFEVPLLARRIAAQRRHAAVIGAAFVHPRHAHLAFFRDQYRVEGAEVARATLATLAVSVALRAAARGLGGGSRPRIARARSGGQP